MYTVIFYDNDRMELGREEVEDVQCWNMNRSRFDEMGFKPDQISYISVEDEGGETIVAGGVEHAQTH